MPETFLRAFALDDISIRTEGGGRIVDAYAAVFNRPAEIEDFDGHYFEVIRPSAFDKTLQENRGRIKVMFNHGRTIYGTPSERFSTPIGRPLEIRTDARGLFTSTRMAETEAAEEVLQLIREGIVDGFSFMGRYIQSRRHPPARSGDLPTIERLEVALLEYGPGIFQAFADAQVVGVRTVVPFQDLPLAPRDRAWDAAAAEARVRAFAGAEDGPNEAYRRAFVWYDRDRADSFGAYKLQIADVVDGRLAAVPRAIFAAAAVLQGARGGVDIPAAEVEGVRAHLGRYYAKMRRVFDDESIVPPWERASYLASVLEELSRDELAELQRLVRARSGAGDPPPAGGSLTRTDTPPPAGELPPEATGPSLDLLRLQQEQRRRTRT